jgi:hypothetical protein
MASYVNGESKLVVYGQFSPSNGDGTLVKLSLVVVVTLNYYWAYWNSIIYNGEFFGLDTNGGNNYENPDLLPFNVFGGLF